ncbi:hypothetical protein B0J13DRAFT_24535 [Dactylonectria estremocensis]|uniref:Uncharacterized protein n=1 Tax=Dactylonectria estremocensis TaxID=1079267 RepID=A0A9P9FK35_9HYPO|nr:hypothetical protein B0J13DRAFT_24535 [Dactylonectria estremocensis]
MPRNRLQKKDFAIHKDTVNGTFLLALSQFHHLCLPTTQLCISCMPELSPPIFEIRSPQFHKPAAASGACLSSIYLFSPHVSLALGLFHPRFAANLEPRSSDKKLRAARSDREDPDSYTQRHHQQHEGSRACLLQGWPREVQHHSKRAELRRLRVQSREQAQCLLQQRQQQHERHVRRRRNPAFQNPPAVRLRPDAINDTPTRWNSSAARVVEPSPEPESSMASEGGEQGDGQWDSTIGKAGLGKTGRVINKLVSDNEALKRDIKIERLRAEESKQAAKLAEDKIERTISDYESRLLEANVTKTLLSRKERQVETLTANVEMEKKKTLSALDRERLWKEEMDKMKADTTVQVDEATSYAQLMEGRYNAISSHWRDQGDEVKRATSKMHIQIKDLVEERKKDDDKIQTLRELCDQQDGNIKQLRHEKEEIARLFEEYKKAQEDALKDIKTNAKKREEEQQQVLDESKEALAKLKWALNVKKSVKGAK